MALPALLAGLVPDLIKQAVGIFDRKFQTEAEKETAVRDFSERAADKIQSAWNEEQKNLTTRHANDMASDSWLSKNIRPMVLVYLMAMFTIAFFREVPQPVLELLRDLLLTVFVFYFGARGLEKIASMMTKK